MESVEGAPPRAGAPAPARGDAGDPLIGRLLDGRYRIGTRIARGGMASVYEATDVRLDRMVAVKVMHAGLGDDADFAARFVREARAAARISHPNVVAVFDQGTDGAEVFLAMEFIRGRTLRDLIRAEAPVSPARAFALFEPMVAALAAAHREGLIHRDVKPENVLLADDGRIKVADFGLAKAVSADTQHTATGGVLIGTVSYLAPELVVEGRADPRADVYAAGVVLYELLTGGKPHEGESPIQVAYKHVHADVPPPSQAVPGLPAYVDALVARATARDRTLRPADAGVLLHQLRRVAQALSDGVVDDPELTADLAPPPVMDGDQAEPDLADHDTDLTERVPPVPTSEPTPDPDVDDADWDERWLITDDSEPAEPGETGAAIAAGAAVAAVAAVDPDVEPTTAVESTAERPVAVSHYDPWPAYTDADSYHSSGAAAGVLVPTAVEPGEATPGRTRSRRGPIILALALLLVVLGGVGAWWFGWGRYTTTPGVVGLTAAEAVEEIEAAGLEADTSEEAYSETVAEGRVISADPGGGTRILDGGTVALVISLGKERYDVPDVVGKTEDRAQDQISRAHLTFGTSTGKWSETVKEGRVISSTPKAGRSVKPGTVVDLVISKGRKPIRFADWTGKDADAAIEALRDKGLKVDAGQTAYSDSVPAGNVISQSPSSGTLYKGDTVTLVVSLGPELVEIPRDGVIAAGVEAARATLRDLGFRVRVREDDTYIGLGFVLRTDPEPGESVPKGSVVTLYII